jgi:hypothetical protein
LAATSSDEYQPPRHLLVEAARLGTVGLAMLWLGLGTVPVAWAINAYWFLLLLALALLGGLVCRKPRAGVVAGEVVLLLAAVQGLWPVLVQPPPLALAALEQRTQGVSWRLAFTDKRQALIKHLHLSPGWETVQVFVRVDLSDDYRGDAGFVLELNGEVVGELNRHTVSQWQIGIGSPHWAYPLPREVLARTPLAQVTLRPAALDPQLSIPGHSDAQIEPLRQWNSWFFDGQTWRNDRLAGPNAGPASGTYRIWLYYLLDPSP